MSSAWGKRGERRRTVIAGTAAAALALAVVSAILIWPRGSASDIALPDESHHSAGTPAVVRETTDPALAVDMTTVEVIEPPVADSAGNAPRTSLAEAAASGSGRTGADGLGQPRGDVEPTDVIHAGLTLGGCNEAYGADGQCLPIIPPSLAQHAADMEEAGLDPATMPHRWTCDEVAISFPDGIVVRVPRVDPDGLDADLDGVACEPDD